MTHRLSALAAALLLAAACRSERVTTGDPIDEPSLRPAPALTGDLARDRAELLRLEDAARAMVRTDGCETAESCAAIAVGVKACGGPRYYLTYCRPTTDESRLQRQVAEIERFERRFNERYQIFSTCEFIDAPTVEATGGSCRVAPPAAPR